MRPVLLIQASAAPVIAAGAAGAAGLTVIVVFALVAVVGDAHGAFEVNTTETLSPLFRVVVVNVGLLVPTFVPLTLH